MNELEENLWKKYYETRDTKIRNEIAKLYLFLVKSISDKLNYNTNQFNKDDLLNVGIIGLLDAIERFDQNRNVKFITYAYFRIRGMILDFIREQEWLPRSIKDKINRLQQAYQSLMEKNIDNPADEQVAAELNMSIDEYYNFLNCVNVRTINSIDDLYDEENSSPVSLVDENYDSDYKKQLIIDILEKCLNEKEKLVISLYYFEELTFKEISEILNLTEARICQLHTLAITKIRTRLKNETIMLNKK